MQAFIGGTCPDYLIEAISDYARDKFGRFNSKAGWSLQPYQKDQNYNEGFGITASFIKYVETIQSGTTKKLFDACYANAYNESAWKIITGKSGAELWDQYAEMNEKLLQFNEKSEVEKENIVQQGNALVRQVFVR